MTLLVVVSVLVLFAVWAVVGVKLLLLARRTRGIPELTLGLGLLFQAGIGYPLGVIARALGDFELTLAVIGSIISNTGCGLLFVFTAYVFHERSRLAWMGVGAAGALLAVHAAGNAIAQAGATTPEARASALLTWGAAILLLSGLAWGWTGLESLRYHARLRKRAQLGLADPIVVDRMRLWGGMGLVAFAAVIANAVLLYGGFAPEVHATVGPVVTSIAGLVVSVCLVLAFLPPRAYLEAVKRRAAAPTS